jgi:hypothetical protein
VFEGKAAAKAKLQAELGLPVDPAAPLFGYIGRLEEQKGVDILLAVSRGEGRRKGGSRPLADQGAGCGTACAGGRPAAEAGVDREIR